MLSTETESSVYRLITSMMKDIATLPKDVKSDCDVLSIVQKQVNISIALNSIQVQSLTSVSYSCSAEDSLAAGEEAA